MSTLRITIEKGQRTVEMVDGCGPSCVTKASGHLRAMGINPDDVDLKPEYALADENVSERQSEDA